MAFGFGGILLAVVAQSPVVEVSEREIRWSEKAVVGLEGGRLLGTDVDGHVVRRLDDVARPVFREMRKAMRDAGAFVSADMRVDAAVRWGVVGRLMLTLELAGADVVNVALFGGDSGLAGRGHGSDNPPLRVRRGIGRLLARHRGIKWSAYPTVWLTKQGYAIYTHPSGRLVHRLRASGRDWIAVLAAIRDVFVGEKNLAIMAVDAITMREMARVRRVARELGFVDARFRPGLFR